MHLNPLPPDLEGILRRYPRVILPELNRGQLAHHLRGKFLIDITPLSKVQGLPFKSREIEAAIDDAVASLQSEQNGDAS